jgi:hypothetical protein
MGRWDTTLWGADAPLDGLGRVVETIARDVARYARTVAGPRTPPRLAAAVGVLLRVSPYAFEPTGKVFPVVQRALRKHDAGVDVLGLEAAAVLRRVAAGEGPGLMTSLLPADEPRRAILGPAGARICCSSLFAHPRARRYVQKIAARAAREVERGLDAFDEELFDDDAVLGPLGLLAVIPGWTLPRATVAGWRARMTARWERALAGGADDPDMEFMRDELWPRTVRLFELITPQV